MGHCVSVLNPSMSAVPKAGPVIQRDDVIRILVSYGVAPTANFKDGSLRIVDYKEFKSFADLSCTFLTKYVLEGNDCDDFAYIFLGRAREYYARMKKVEGICFGYLDGDIRLKKEDPPRYHAVNWFIDEKKRFMIYDPMWNEIYEYKDHMTIWSIIA